MIQSDGTIVESQVDSIMRYVLFYFSNTKTDFRNFQKMNDFEFDFSGYKYLYLNFQVINVRDLEVISDPNLKEKWCNK